MSKLDTRSGPLTPSDRERNRTVWQERMEASDHDAAEAVKAANAGDTTVATFLMMASLREAVVALSAQVANL